jgi:hypothetical protein
MADIENNNRAFQVDGIDLRSKQKAIIEDSLYSRSIEVDVKSSARIFLHDDGQLYFKDNEIKNPIPLTRVENVYERIKVEDGELRFYDRELKNFVNLSKLNRDKSAFQKNNSVIYSNTTVFDIDETFNANAVLENAYSNYGSPISGAVYTDGEITTAETQFKNTFSGSTVNGFGETPIDLLFDNYLTGIYLNTETESISGAPISGSTPLTLSQIQELGYDTFEDYFAGKQGSTENEDFVWPIDWILPDQSLFLSDNEIGFIEQDGDALGKVYFENKSINFVYDYMFSNLYKYNGVSKFIDSIFGIPNIADFEMTPSISGGLYLSSPVNELSSVLLEEISKAISHTMINEFVKRFEEQLVSANLLVDTRIRPASEILGAPSVFDLAQSALSVMNNATFKATIMSVIDYAFDEESTPLLAMNTLNEEEVGGLFGAMNYLPIDLLALNDQWFDMPNIYKVSPVVANENAITLSVHFPINIKPRRNTRYEFRLIDTVSNQELDRIQIESSDFKNVTGDVFIDKKHVHPVQLSYFGPMPQFSCDEKSFRDCFDSEDILTHKTILVDDCLTANPIGDEGGFRNIADRFLADITTEVNEKDAVKIDTPRIFKVQWRAVHLDEDYSILTNYRALSDLDFNGLTGFGEARMSMSVYNIAPKKDGSLIKQGVVSFDSEDKKTVQFDFSLSTEQEYSISLSCSKNIKVWYETKSSHGFVIRAEKRFEGEVTWIFSKRITLEEIEGDAKKLPLCFVDSTPSFGSLSNFDILRDEGYDV